MTATDPEAPPVRDMPPVGRLLSALGVDPTTATDADPSILITQDRVFIQYTGLLAVSPEAFLRAASVARFPDGFTLS